MIDLDQHFEMIVTKDKMKATLIEHSKLADKSLLTKENIIRYSQKSGIVYGLAENVLATIQKNGRAVLAMGKSAKDGKDAYLQSVVFQGEVEESSEVTVIDFKRVLDIPSVRAGDQVGRKVAATIGEAGITVFGEEVVAKQGKDFKLRAGKNVRLQESEQALYALTDGQITVSKYLIHVLPIYEVNGDVSLKTGNISFIGNVIIRGNVPTGFVIEATGDIRVMGTVEGAKLKAGGSIFIGAGIVGQNKSQIEAKGDLQTSFINQGHVYVNGNLNVVQTIYHSTCTSGGSIVCKQGKGLIIGGSLSASSYIQANEIGNDMQTKTVLSIGVHEQQIQLKKQLKTELEKEKSDFIKLAKILKVYYQKEKQSSPLVGKEKLQKIKVQHALQQTKQLMDELTERLNEYTEQEERTDGNISVERAIYPNVEVYFGKYRRKVVTVHRQPHISIIDSEVVIVTK